MEQKIIPDHGFVEKYFKEWEKRVKIIRYEHDFEKQIRIIDYKPL